MVYVEIMVYGRHLGLEVVPICPCFGVYLSTIVIRDPFGKVSGLVESSSALAYGPRTYTTQGTASTWTPKAGITMAWAILLHTFGSRQGSSSASGPLFASMFEHLRGSSR